MAKNRNKKKRNAAVAMDIAEDAASDVPQAMDMSESVIKGPASSAHIKKVKKGRPMKRSKKVRKIKAMEKAISVNEKYVEKNLKDGSKKLRTESAKTLYD